MNEQQRQVTQLIMKSVNERIQRFVGESLTRDTHNFLYAEVFDVISTFASSAPHFQGMSNDAVNFAAQAVYDMIEISGEPTDPNIFTRRVRTGDINTQDLRLLLVMFADTPIAPEVVVALKKRSQ